MGVFARFGRKPNHGLERTARKRSLIPTVRRTVSMPAFFWVSGSGLRVGGRWRYGDWPRKIGDLHKRLFEEVQLHAVHTVLSIFVPQSGWCATGQARRTRRWR
jgi:hypothetical protein